MNLASFSQSEPNVNPKLPTRRGASEQYLLLASKELFRLKIFLLYRYPRNSLLLQYLIYQRTFTN
jgi:hypothetical protein